MEFLSKNVEDTAKIASDFAEQLYRRAPSAKATVVGLYGELGSGKTTFMKYLAEYFGIEEAIKSPTFVIMRKYEIRGTSNEVRKESNPSNLVTPNSRFDFLIHIDAYRIEKEEEMINLDWEKLISDPKNLICIEWPNKIAGIMPPHIVIKFEHVESFAKTEDPERSERVRETERKISIA